jgi:hypothetical protein
LVDFDPLLNINNEGVKRIRSWDEARKIKSPDAKKAPGFPAGMANFLAP